MGQFTETCPKCKGFAWYERVLLEHTGMEVVLRCICGYERTVYSRYNGVERLHPLPERDLVMPRQGTRSSQCLGVVAGRHPTLSTTGEVAGRLGWKNGDTANFLMVLMHKGLLEKTTEGRGVAGGSTWKLTRRALIKLKL